MSSFHGWPVLSITELVINNSLKSILKLFLILCSLIVCRFSLCGIIILMLKRCLIPLDAILLPMYG